MRTQSSVPIGISADRDASMVSEPAADETEGIGDDPEEDGILDLNQRNSLEDDRRMEDDPQQDNHSYKEQSVDSRMKFLKGKIIT